MAHFFPGIRYEYTPPGGSDGGLKRLPNFGRNMCLAKKNKAYSARNAKAGRHSRLLGAAPRIRHARTEPQHSLTASARNGTVGLIAGLRTRAVHLAPLTRPVKCAPRDCEAKGVNGRSYGTTVDAPRPYFAQNGPRVHVEAPPRRPNCCVRRAEWRRGGVVDLRSRIRPNRRVINEAPGGRATTGARQARFFSL